MATLPLPDPDLGDRHAADAIETVIVPRLRDIGAFEVRRALPAAQKQMVGPFIFLDQFGPVEMISSETFDVRPHPHIGLATVTFLYEGEIVHRDSVGSRQAIRPGDVNWMTAGRGIAHSERTPREKHGEKVRSHGFQMWVALPKAHEEAAPSFAHSEAGGLPLIAGDGAEVRLAVGTLYGERAPVATFSETFFADFSLAAGARVPIDAEHEERAIYLAEGTIAIAGDRFEPGRLIVLRPGDPHVVTAVTAARFVLLGGATMDGPRHIWWNFVSSSKARIEAAKADWREGRFDKVFGDEVDFIPLPE
jgi:redox-sensitive bicupin YhaK (pirin superfamily)